GVFPALSECSNLQEILKLCIASLVLHHDYLRDTLPTSHPLLATYLFRQPDVLALLRLQLSTGGSAWMQTTGIPPHVELYKQLLQVQASIDKLPPVLIQGISNLIEEKVWLLETSLSIFSRPPSSPCWSE
ncbi:hypothetical protein JG687_00018694, partial [Phytophthora cactorum]